MTSSLARRRSSGFTLLELAVVVCVIAILGGFLLDRMRWYQEQAEKVAMEQIVGSIRSALHLQMSALIAKGKAHEIRKLAEKNPMNLLAEKPANYLGEYFAPKPQDIALGYWYFDLRNGNLIYSVRNSAHFRSEIQERNLVRFRVEVIAPKQEKANDFAAEIEGITLNPVVPYTWF